MITQWKVFNFKSVRKETDLSIAPLTIFAGANSSGKSTFLQSILLVAQTLANKVSSRSVVLNGSLTRLGQFDDLKSADSDANQIVIGWTCQPVFDPEAIGMWAPSLRRAPYGRPLNAFSSVTCEIAFDTVDSGSLRDITQIQPRLFSSVVSATTRDSHESARAYSVGIRRATADDVTAKHRWSEVVAGEDTFIRDSLQYEVVLDNSSLGEIHEELVSAEPIGCVFRHFLPERIALGIHIAPEMARLMLGVLVGEGPRTLPRRPFVDRHATVPKAVVDYVLRISEKISASEVREVFGHTLNEAVSSSPSGVPLELFLDVFRRIPPRARMEIRRQIVEDPDLEDLVKAAIREENGERLEVALYRMPGALGDACWYLDQFFASSVRYLGPLRDEPKSLYPLSPTADPSDVGLKGEHTAAVLELHKNRPIRYIPTSAFATDEVVPTPATRSLEAAVVEWLQYLGVADSIQSHDKGKFGHELVVSIAGGTRHHDLTHVGVGVSQVLPILVASLLADSDTTLVFEQPELHLHPKVQTLLADFFLSMTLLGKQCIIETHSEYLVNQIRLRTAAAVTSTPWIKAVKVYFVERGLDGSSFRDVEINEYGAILNWPEGFFDQSPRVAEEILRAAMKKRRAQRKGGMSNE